MKNVFCERVGAFGQQRHSASTKAQEQRAAGTAFHESRAARSGNNRQDLWWAFTLLLAALAVWFFRAVVERR